MNSFQIVDSVWDILPDWAKEEWSELPTDVDSMVGHDWIRDVLKGGLIRMYKEFTKQLKQGNCGQIEIAGILIVQDKILKCLGSIEIFFDELKTENSENLLDELYDLVLKEQEGRLSDDEKKKYVEITDFLRKNDIEIPFGIEL